jgi:hypothetical protein
MINWKMQIPNFGTTFEVEQLHRDKSDLYGELTVRCTLPGAQTVNGDILSSASFNFMSHRARQERAKYLALRAKTNGKCDWAGWIEEFSLGVIAREREGEPIIKLRDYPRPEIGDEFKVHGLVFPRRHPTIMFGDGSAAKSYTALYLAGLLVQRGLKIGLFDWELCGDDHRLRYEFLFGQEMPEMLFYAKCERPIQHETFRLSRFVRDKKLEYCLFDSIAFACDEPPETAAMASKYFRCVREIASGSLHLAHTNRSDKAEDKPFGSVFWHNGARMTWFVKAAETSPTVLDLGFFCKKNNLQRKWPPAGFRVTFTESATSFKPSVVADVPELAEKLSVRERADTLLKRGSLTWDELSAEMSVSIETLQRTVRRNKNHFIVLAGGRVGLRA